MSGMITEKQKLRLSEQLNTSPEIIGILFPDVFVAGKMIRILRDKFYLERLKDEAMKTGTTNLKRLLNYLDRKNYDSRTWQKILELLKVKPFP